MPRPKAERHLPAAPRSHASHPMTFTRRALLAATLGITAAMASADDLTTTDGKKLSGKLVAVDTQGVTFSTADAQVKVPGKDIIVLDLGNKVAPPPKDPDGRPARIFEIELIDGSAFRAGKFVLKGKQVETELFPGPGGVTSPTFELPMPALFSVLRGAEEPKNREGWKKVLAARGKRDMYVERRAETLDFVQGTILSGTDDGKEFDFEREDGTKTKLIQSRATGGLVFAQPQAAQVPQTLCKVLDVFGNSLTAQS